MMFVMEEFEKNANETPCFLSYFSFITSNFNVSVN